MITQNQLNKVCQTFFDCAAKHLQKPEMTRAEEVETRFLYGYLSASDIGAAKMFAKRLKESRVIALWNEYEKEMEKILND